MGRVVPCSDRPEGLIPRRGVEKHCIVGVFLLVRAGTGLGIRWVMDIPRESGWRIKIEGDVNLNIDIDFPPELNQEQRVAQGMSTTGFHLVNSVRMVCEADNPGIKTYLDLPMITGRMGTHTIQR